MKLSGYSEEERLLIIENEKLILAMAKQYAGFGVDGEELLDAAISGLLKWSNKAADTKVDDRFYGMKAWYIRQAVAAVVSKSREDGRSL